MSGPDRPTSRAEAYQLGRLHGDLTPLDALDAAARRFPHPRDEMRPAGDRLRHLARQAEILAAEDRESRGPGRPCSRP